MTNNLYLESLKAIDSVDMSVYKEALDIALQNKENTNIALSGAYGSGKSSIIESYKKNYADGKKFLHISLGQYDTDMNNEDKCSNDSEVKEKDIEGKIINQLLHQIDTSKIPQTIFKVKREMNKYCLTILSVLISFFLVLLVYILNFSQWFDFLQKNLSKLSFLSFTTNELTLIIAIVGVFILLCLFTYKIVTMQYNKGILKKLSVKGYDVEIMAGNNESYFDKYLNDVIYLFENSGVDIIVFEDIDRFNSGKIFANLREINTLVNTRKKEGKEDKKLVFLYLLRDDIFTSKDRTKFFDIIIPVIPVVDASNSYEKFIEIFKKGDILDKFELNFLQKLSLYVDDMRLLKNIYNEFIIYQKEIDEIELDCNKLLALITYKNIFPRDFADLQLSKGFVYSVFSQKGKLVTKKTATLKSDLQNIQLEIDELEKETLVSTDELDILAINNPSNYKINGKGLNEFESLQIFIKELKNDENVVLETINGRTYQMESSSIANIFNKSEYKNRKIQIQKKGSNKITELKSKKEAICRELDIISSYRLEKMITNEDFSEVVQSKKDEVHLYEAIEQSNYYLLLVFLIKNGYINETYTEYMTYFYANSITIGDKLFLRSITDERSLDWFYSLNNIGQVIERMEEYDFSKKEAWNADLLKYMLENREKYDSQLRRLISSLTEANNIEFFKRFFIKNQEIREINVTFLEIIFFLWDNFVQNILYLDNGINIASLKIALENFDKEVISKQNTNNEITMYLNNTTIDFLADIHTNLSEVVENLTFLGVEFTKVDFLSLENQLAEGIYENSLYEINMGNLSSILGYYYNNYDVEKFKHENYTLIKNMKLSPLLEHIKQHVNLYMMEYIKISEGSIRDSEDNVIELLNNEEIEDKVKADYIYELETKISNITSIVDTSIWKQLIEKDVVIPSEVNVVEYYHFNKNSWNEELVGFVNRSANNIPINLAKVNKKLDKIDIFTNTINRFTLNNDKYITLLDSMKKSYTGTGSLIGVDNFRLNDVPKEKIAMLIENQIIHMSEGCLNDIRDYYPEEINHFIKQNLDSYLELIQNREIYNEDEILNLLDASSDLELSQQRDVLMNINHPISINDKGYSTDLINVILEEKFEISDLSFIIDNYANYPSVLQKTVVTKSIKYLDEILYRNIDITDKELLEFILRSSQVSLEQRQNLFSIRIARFSKDEIRNYISILKMPDEFAVLLKGEGRRPKLQINNINKRILDYFETENWITSYSDKNGKYEARGKNNKKTSNSESE